MPYQYDRQRLPRVLASCMLIGFGFVGIILASKEQSISPLPGILIFSGYLYLAGVLITKIISRLHRQHEIRKFKFDLANLVMLSALIALPFGLASAFAELFKIGSAPEFGFEKQYVLLVLSGMAFCLMAPVFFIAEAVVSIYSLFLSKSR